MHFHNNHHFSLTKTLHDKMSGLYIYHSLLTFAKSLIGVFVPVYLFKNGFSVSDILWYTIAVSVVFLILVPIGIKSIEKIGFKYTILLATPWYLIHIVFLNYINSSPYNFHLAWISFSIYVGFFRPAYHSELALNWSRKHRSSQMGTLQILSTLFGTFAPLIGGYFLNLDQFWYLLILANVLILVGIIPLLLSKDLKLKDYSFPYKKYWHFLTDKKLSNSKIVFAFSWLQSALRNCIWPVVLFIYLNENYLSFGTLTTVVSLISVVIIIILKNWFDHNDKSKYYQKVTQTEWISWFFKGIIYLFSVKVLFFIEGVSRLFHNVHELLYMSIFYNNAQKIGTMDYIVLREFYLHTIRIIFCLALISIFHFIWENTTVLTTIAILGVFISLGLSKFKEDN